MIIVTRVNQTTYKVETDSGILLDDIEIDGDGSYMVHDEDGFGLSFFDKLEDAARCIADRDGFSVFTDIKVQG